MLICKQISGLLLLFSSKRVFCHCGAHHNAEMNLSGTENKYAIRLWAIGSYAHDIIRPQLTLLHDRCHRIVHTLRRIAMTF